MPIYKIASKEVLKEVNQMARREGISKYGQSVYIPSFATYGFDLTRDDFAKGGRVEMPMLMLWPESFKPQSKGFEKHLDVAGLLQEEALQDFKRSHRSLKKEVQKRKLLRNYTVFKRRSRGG